MRMRVPDLVVVHGPLGSLPLPCGAGNPADADRRQDHVRDVHGDDQRDLEIPDRGGGPKPGGVNADKQSAGYSAPHPGYSDQ